MTRSEVAVERKNQIVKATVDCISKYGYNNFSMQDVARIAGVSKGIIHYYFLNKDDLMMSVLEHVADDISSLLTVGMNEEADPIKKLEILISTCLNVVRKTKEFYQVNMDFWTQINQKGEVRHTVAKYYRNFRETCSKVLVEGAEKGVFCKVNPVEFSSLIIAMVDGISLQWLFDENAFDYDHTIEQVKTMVLSCLLKTKVVAAMP